jgi:hypothetical protein
LAWVIKKVKLQQWKERKRISQIINQQKKCAFFRQEVLRKMYGKEQYRKEKQKRVNCIKLVPIIYIKGSCYETPLYDHVLGDKRDGDKDEV